MFIKHLNNKESESRKLENELKDIVIAFESFVNAIESVDAAINDHVSGKTTMTRKEIDRQLSEVEDCLSQMIGEFRVNKIERVVSLALDVARNANEIFLNFAKSTTTAANN